MSYSAITKLPRPGGLHTVETYLAQDSEAGNPRSVLAWLGSMKPSYKGTNSIRESSTLVTQLPPKAPPLILSHWA